MTSYARGADPSHHLNLHYLAARIAPNFSGRSWSVGSHCLG